MYIEHEARRTGIVTLRWSTFGKACSFTVSVFVAFCDESNKRWIAGQDSGGPSKMFVS